MGGNNKIMIMSLIPMCVLGVILPESVQESMGPHFLVGPSIEESAQLIPPSHLSTICQFPKLKNSSKCMVLSLTIAHPFRSSCILGRNGGGLICWILNSAQFNLYGFNRDKVWLQIQMQFKITILTKKNQHDYIF